MAAAAREVAPAETIMLRSSDGEYFRVPVREAMGSETLAETITTRMDEGDYVDGCVIPLASVDSSTLARVIEYLKMMYDAHCGRATSEATAQRWGRLFIEETDTILDLLSAADYLRIPYLLNLTSKNAARKLSGKSADEVKKILNIAIHLNQQEEKQVLQQNSWAFE